MTTISSDISDFEHTRYGAVVKLIPKDGEEEDTIDLSDFMTELRIVKKYDEHVMPYYRLTVAVSVVNALKIQAAWRSAKVYITLGRFTASGASADDTSGTVETDTGETYLRDAPFQIMVCDGAPPHVPDGQASDSAMNTPSVLFKMELAPVNALEINKKVNNGAYHDAAMTSIVASLTADNAPTDIPYRFFMAPSDNPKVYETVFVPPLSYVAAVRHVDRVYGLYAGRLSIFLDVNEGYILSSTKSTVVDKDEATAVTIEYLGPEEAGPASSGSGSAYDPDTRTFRLRTSRRIAAAVDGPARREVEGERVKLVRSTADERSGSNCKSLVQDDQSGVSDVKKERVAWQTYDNPLTVERMRIEAREQYSPASVFFSSCDLDAFTPVLQWTLVTDKPTSAEMEGRWRITAFEAVLTKAPGAQETCAVDVNCILVPSAARAQ